MVIYPASFLNVQITKNPQIPIRQNNISSLGSNIETGVDVGLYRDLLINAHVRLTLPFNRIC